ncbi:MAG: biotin synthase BioB [Thermoleophilia bacterium]|nr:biotin synthase BioB [Thermoleophilia bacterium]
MKNKVDNWTPLLKSIGDKLMSGGYITFSDALQLTQIPEESVGDLIRLADRVRRRFASEKADLCSIVNARSGRCAEDCRFCAQSVHFDTEAPVFPMKPVKDILRAAVMAEAAGAHRFCIVTSGDSLSERDFGTVVEAIGRIREETGLRRCASIGRLSRERTATLREAGLNRYHHNVETARGFFPSVCATHTYEDKLRTIRHLQEYGIEKCIGGILNLGESPRQRIQMAFEIRELQPDSVPVNFLIPWKGTPLGGRKPIAAIEAARYLAIFRLVMPRVYIRVAGGRLETFEDHPTLPFDAGVNALLIGDLLTTPGPNARSDITLLRCLGFDLDGRE